MTFFNVAMYRPKNPTKLCAKRDAHTEKTAVERKISILLRLYFFFVVVFNPSLSFSVATRFVCHELLLVLTITLTRTAYICWSKSQTHKHTHTLQLHDYLKTIVTEYVIQNSCNLNVRNAHYIVTLILKIAWCYLMAAFSIENYVTQVHTKCCVFVHITVQPCFVPLQSWLILLLPAFFLFSLCVICIIVKPVFFFSVWCIFICLICDAI